MSAIAEPMTSEQQLVAFHLAGETYGVDIALINEIIRMREITFIPRTPPEVEGIINLRGKIVPIVDLRKRMELPTVPQTSATRMIVLAFEEHIVGIIVDRVEGVVRLSDSDIELPSQLITRRDQDYVRAVGKTGDKLVILLNIQKVLRIEGIEAIAA
jgi:purine-binding chemotaxis protein CheW